MRNLDANLDAAKLGAPLYIILINIHPDFVSYSKLSKFCIVTNKVVFMELWYDSVPQISMQTFW